MKIEAPHIAYRPQTAATPQPVAAERATDRGERPDTFQRIAPNKFALSGGPELAGHVGESSNATASPIASELPAVQAQEPMLKGYLTLPLTISGRAKSVPLNVGSEQLVFEPKSELHVTLALNNRYTDHVDQLVDVIAQQCQCSPKMAECFFKAAIAHAAQQVPLQVNFSGQYELMEQVSDTGQVERRSIVTKVELPALAEFYQHINAHLRQERQVNLDMSALLTDVPHHVTLFTAVDELGRGIGIGSHEDYERLKTPQTLDAAQQDEIHRQLLTMLGRS